ncbi:MAG: hypothetical protein JWL62_387 [Hyphomicrobiales bacterium]|nr:hypothetical protein [Hyphomicrobiales bacterium]
MITRLVLDLMVPEKARMDLKAKVEHSVEF